MAKILGLSGSLRQGSLNSMLLRAAAALAPVGIEVEIGTIQGIPLYDGDVESSAYPQSVTDLKSRITACDGLLLVTPEYNNGVPGVFKNAIDWLSRPSTDMARVFGGRPVALMGASPGPFGTVLAQEHWLATLRTLGTLQWNGSKLTVARAGAMFNDTGELTDENTRKQVQKFMHGFAGFVQSQHRQPIH